MRFIYLFIYLSILKHLPATDGKYPCSGQIRRMRSSVGKHLFDSCGDKINIEKNANFGNGRKISIGRKSGLGINCKVRGPLTIGDNVMMGPDVMIYVRNHATDRTDIPMCEQGSSESRQVTIGNDVWIGARVIILPGVTIGNGSIIGAGAVVTKSIPPYSVAVGNPARVVKSRKKTPNIK